jgi:hypothetical protein
LFRAGVLVPKDEAVALRYYQQAAEGGMTSAMIELGRAYRFGPWLPRDVQQAIRWFQRASEAGDALGTLNLGWVYGYEPAAPINLERAFALYLNAAQSGQACAMHELYLCYNLGRGVDLDPNEARKWLVKGAAAGCEHAQCALGFSFEDPVVQDPVDVLEAVKWYRKAADQGYAPAKYYLGLCCLDGNGVVASEEEALQWFRQAADDNERRALRQLADCYAAGIGEPRGPEDAPVLLLERAARLGDTYAFSRLVPRLKSGLGTPRDLVRAAQWHCRAALLGHTGFWLDDKLEGRPPEPVGSSGFWLQRGGNSPPMFVDPRELEFLEVLSLYLKSARLPDGAAPAQLARRYLAGQGAPKSDARAWLWFSIAAARGTSDAQAEVRRLESSLPPTGLAEAKKLLSILVEDLNAVAQAPVIGVKP